jgi:hypothetical protein
MKKRLNISILLILVTIFTILSVLNSCKKEAEIAAPSITLEELGYQNTKVAFRGNDLHIDAYLLAEGKIANVNIDLHPEGTHSANKATAPSPIRWEFDSVYTGKYYGIKNADFHEHIEIPMSADTGHYHFHFSVTDLEGNRTSIEEEIQIVDSLLIQ